MSWGCSHIDKLSIDRYDLGGVQNVLMRRIKSLPQDAQMAQAYYLGAYVAFEVCLDSEWKTQDVFFKLFDAALDEMTGVEHGQD